MSLVRHFPDSDQSLNLGLLHTWDVLRRHWGFQIRKYGKEKSIWLRQYNNDPCDSVVARWLLGTGVQLSQRVFAWCVQGHRSNLQLCKETNGRLLQNTMLAIHRWKNKVRNAAMPQVCQYLFFRCLCRVAHQYIYRKIGIMEDKLPWQQVLQQ